MIDSTSVDNLSKIISDSQHIVIIQADNPDGDSLGTSLALEELLEEQGKKVSLFCAVDIPSYLRYAEGWDRVSKDLPNQFDASIIVDVSTKTLLENLDEQNQLGWLAAKPCIVIDHHTSVTNGIDFADVSIIDASYASTGDIVFHIAKLLNWQITPRAAEMIMISILGDTQGLSNSLASTETYRTMAELIESGADRPALEDRRKEAGKMPRSILLYKAALIMRAEFVADDSLATVTIPPEEIKVHSPLYNPAPLIQNDLLQTEGVQVAIVFKYYQDKRVTAAIRCNPPFAIADKLAETFGGGGHPYASGFRDITGRGIDEVKRLCLETATTLIDEQRNR